MNRTTAILAASILATTLSACGSNSLFSRDRPDEMMVSRQAPLVVPPDFALVPPQPGQPRPQEADSSTQALNALFGGNARVSQGEGALTAAAGGQPTPGIRSEAGDPNTQVVNKGSATRDILKAPPSADPQANATAPH